MVTYFLQFLRVIHPFPTAHFSEFKADVSLVHGPVIEPVTCNLLTSFLRNVTTTSFTFLLIFFHSRNQTPYSNLKLTDIHCLPLEISDRQAKKLGATFFWLWLCIHCATLAQSKLLFPSLILINESIRLWDSVQNPGD